MILTQADAARLVGCSKANLCKMYKTGTANFFTDSGKVDTEHPDWKHYAERRGRPSQPEELEEMGARGAQARYVLARAKKMQEDALTAELKRKKQLGELVSVDVVRRVTYDYLEELNKQLLGTGHSIVDRIIQIVLASGEGSRPEVMELLSHYISASIRGTKESIRRGLDQYE